MQRCKAIDFGSKLTCTLARFLGLRLAKGSAQMRDFRQQERWITGRNWTLGTNRRTRNGSSRVEKRSYVGDGGNGAASWFGESFQKDLLRAVHYSFFQFGLLLLQSRHVRLQMLQCFVKFLLLPLQQQLVILQFTLQYKSTNINKINNLFIRTWTQTRINLKNVIKIKSIYR